MPHILPSVRSPLIWCATTTVTWFATTMATSSSTTTTLPVSWRLRRRAASCPAKTSLSPVTSSGRASAWCPHSRSSSTRRRNIRSMSCRRRQVFRSTSSRSSPPTGQRPTRPSSAAVTACVITTPTRRTACSTCSASYAVSSGVRALASSRACSCRASR